HTPAAGSPIAGEPVTGDPVTRGPVTGRADHAGRPTGAGIRRVHTRVRVTGPVQAVPPTEQIGCSVRVGIPARGGQVHAPRLEEQPHPNTANRARYQFVGCGEVS